jgi:hypothetical protein
MVVNAIAEGLALRDSFVEHFDIYEGYSEPPVERLAKVIAAMDWRNRKLASRPTSSVPPIGTSCAAVCPGCGLRIAST